MFIGTVVYFRLKTDKYRAIQYEVLSYFTTRGESILKTPAKTNVYLTNAFNGYWDLTFFVWLIWYDGPVYNL